MNKIFNKSLFCFKRRIPGKSSTHTFLFWTLLPLILGIVPFIFHSFFIAGSSRIPKKGGLLLLCNHQSHYDVLLCAIAFLNRPFRAMGRKNLFKIPIIGWVLYQLGGISLNRGIADKQAVYTAIETLREDRPILIFPEGTRTSTGEIDKFAPGFLLILKKNPVKVMPIAIAGADKSWPRGRKPTFKGKMGIAIGRPIDPKFLLDMPSGEAQKFMQRRVKRLQNALERIM